MSRYKDFREPRRRGFDDDNYTPPPPTYGRDRPAASRPAAAPSGPPVPATVKWYNSQKGFGFVSLDDGSGDAFLHASAVQAAGHEEVQPGARLSVRVGQGQKGMQVSEVLSVEPGAAPPEQGGRSFDRPAPRAPRAAPSGPTEEVEGVVKWYDPNKGFGFIAREGGGKDVFVHVSVLNNTGFTMLEEGQRVIVQVAQGAKGPEARSLVVPGNRRDR